MLSVLRDDLGFEVEVEDGLAWAFGDPAGEEVALGDLRLAG